MAGRGVVAWARGRSAGGNTAGSTRHSRSTMRQRHGGLAGLILRAIVSRCACLSPLLLASSPLPLGLQVTSSVMTVMVGEMKIVVILLLAAIVLGEVRGGRGRKPRAPAGTWARAPMRFRHNPCPQGCFFKKGPGSFQMHSWATGQHSAHARCPIHPQARPQTRLHANTLPQHSAANAPLPRPLPPLLAGAAG